MQRRNVKEALREDMSQVSTTIHVTCHRRDPFPICWVLCIKVNLRKACMDSRDAKVGAIFSAKARTLALALPVTLAFRPKPDGQTKVSHFVEN